MKRLFLTFGLVIAFLISVNNANAALGSIFDTASYQAPKNVPTNFVFCQPEDTSKISFKADWYSGDKSVCLSLAKSLVKVPPKVTNGKPDTWTVNSCFYRGTSYEMDHIDCSGTRSFTFCKIENSQQVCESNTSAQTFTSIARGGRNKVDNSYSCPPDAFPLYTVGVDNNNDGKDDQCYNPDELDNLSNCANEVGSMLPAITNLSNKVCKTDPNSGARCGYSKKDGDIVYKADLEMNCFGDGEKVPEYDPEPMPEPDKCAKYNDQLMVCKADPKEKCDALGNCGDQCGFVNKELFCFIDCEGADCDKETPPPPVNCETNPTAPVCVEEPEPDPEFCKANPTDPKCTVEPPEPCTGDDCGSTGGGGEKVDLKPVVDQLKDINSKLDFSTEKGEGRKKFGAFDDLFGDADLLEIKNMTTEKKDEATQLINNVKDEFSGLFKVSSVGGSYDDLTLDFSYGSYSSKVWEFFQQNVSIIASAIMALAWLLAASIVMGGRND